MEQKCKEKFELELTAKLQVQLLDELLQAHEMSGQITEQVQSGLSARTIRKPCPKCPNTMVCKHGKQFGSIMPQCREVKIV